MLNIDNPFDIRYQWITLYYMLHVKSFTSKSFKYRDLLIKILHVHQK